MVFLEKYINDVIKKHTKIVKEGDFVGIKNIFVLFSLILYSSSYNCSKNNWWCC